VKKNNGTIRCDVCDGGIASHIAMNPNSPLVKDDLGIGRMALFLCKVCVGGTVGASLVALGIAVLEVVAK